jgi:hypothetical protein
MEVDGADGDRENDTQQWGTSTSRSYTISYSSTVDGNTAPSILWQAAATHHFQPIRGVQSCGGEQSWVDPDSEKLSTTTTMGDDRIFITLEVEAEGPCRSSSLG